MARRRKLYVSKATQARLTAAKHQKWRKSRTKQQEGLCFYCKRLMREDLARLKPTLDHYVPLSLEGVDHYENTVAACATCNEAKRSVHGDVFTGSPKQLEKAGAA